MQTTDTASPISILVVTGEQHARSVIGDTLQKDGHELVYAPDAGQAVALCKNKKFDILIADYHLPDMSGLELVKSVNQLGLDITPIIMSDVGSLEIALEGMKLGVHDYMMQPLNTTELTRNVAAIISERVRMRQGSAKFKDIIGRIVPRTIPEMLVVVPYTQVADEELSWFGRRVRAVGRFLKRFFKFIWDVEER